MDELFKGRHFDREIIVLCVRWDLRYKLSFRGSRGDDGRTWTLPAHTTIMRWIQHYAPEFRETLEPLLLGQLDGPGASTMTYVKIKATLDLSLPCRR